jgi:hypothetical protein
MSFRIHIIILLINHIKNICGKGVQLRIFVIHLLQQNIIFTVE